MRLHKPVLLKEVLTLLDLTEGEIVLDATLGSGGHSRHLAEKIGIKGRLIGLDQDPASIERCHSFFHTYPQVILRRANFKDAEKIIKELNLPGVDAVIVDTGFSSDQLEDPVRGLSFEREGPLDMRLDPDRPLTAREIVNQWPEKDLARIFWEYGEERKSRQFAHAIAEARRKKTIETTLELVEVLGKLIPGYTKSKKNLSIRSRHFATRIFQALRIAVNDELNVLRSGLENLWNVLKPKGRLVVITFHSLEDRIVKRLFKSWQLEKKGILLNKKVVIAGWDEIKLNRRSRSAKLRGIKKI